MATIALDVEIYKDYFLVCMKDVRNGKTHHFEWYEGKHLQRQQLRDMLKRNKVITFNGMKFDMPLINYALQDKTTIADVKSASDAIIVHDQPYWTLGLSQFEKCDHVDLMEVAPGRSGLKQYGGRMHCEKLQDLPIAPDASITPDDRALMREYCYNDLDLTIALYNRLLPQLELRQKMTEEYGTDLRSKSDAQIAEAVIKAKLQEAGAVPRKPAVNTKKTFKYYPPAFIHFSTPALRLTLDMIASLEFSLDKSGAPKCPALENHKVTIGNSVYRMGIGGLHSSEQSTAHYSDENVVLIDRDVASYYPMIILNCGLYPKHLGEEFLTVYRSIVDRRLEAKRNKDTVTADALKITINGSFGKFGSQYSVLYSPELLIQTTVTGQLSLLMLIEWLESVGIPVVSANTDGIVIKCPRHKLDELSGVIWLWEFFTGFVTEETRYKALYSRDVNNYIAIKEGGGVKTKGAYASTNLMKSPVGEVCTLAVTEYLENGADIAATIFSCADITKFVTIRQVKGGAQYKGRPIGKVVRWYYGRGATDAIHYISNGNKVATSDGAIPVMELPDTLPKDIDYHRYIKMATATLADLGL
jgi:DNA polymerase elongation subunit (family B)